MTLHLTDHLAVVFLVVVYPIWGYVYLRKRRALIDAGKTELRATIYRRIIGEEWVMALVLLGIWFALGRSGAAIGLVPQVGPLVWAGYGFATLICAVLLLQAWSIIRSPKNRALMRDTLGPLSYLLPHTRGERRTFEVMSVTAGVCEEVIFRGFLIAYLIAAFGAPFWVAAVLSSIVFGLAHAYQGPAGIPRTALAGGSLAWLYGMTGSLWAPMIAHAVMDITSGRIAFASFTHNTPDRSSLDRAA